MARLEHSRFSCVFELWSPTLAKPSWLLSAKVLVLAITPHLQMLILKETVTASELPLMKLPVCTCTIIVAYWVFHWFSAFLAINCLPTCSLWIRYLPAVRAFPWLVCFIYNNIRIFVLQMLLQHMYGTNGSWGCILGHSLLRMQLLLRDFARLVVMMCGVYEWVCLAPCRSCCRPDMLREISGKWLLFSKVIDK